MWRYRCFHCYRVCLLNCTNSLVYHRNIFESSSKVFSNLRKMFGNIRLAFGTILEIFENLRKSSESSRKSSESHRKTVITDFYIIHVSSKRWILCSRCAHSEILFSPLEHKIHIFSSPCNILYFPLSNDQNTTFNAFGVWNKKEMT